MIRNEDNIKNVDGHEKFLAGGSAIFVLGEWVVKIDLLANRSTHWPVGWPIHQVQPIGQRIDPLANTL